MPQQKFHTAWIVEPGKDFAPLRDISLEQRFICSGLEQDQREIAQAVQSFLKVYDPRHDVIVPVGRVLAVWEVANTVALLFEEGYFAAYKAGEYHVQEWPTIQP
jgi:hypothetical protein